MKHISWQVALSLTLIMLSAIFYGIHYAIFMDAHHIFVYLIGDIAFVFIEVLLVTIIIHRVLEEREKKARLEKLNMVIGAFFSEIGTRMLEFVSSVDRNKGGFRDGLVVDKEWTPRQFTQAAAEIKQHEYEVEPKSIDWLGLRDMLAAQRDFLLRLLENPNLLEHETFTELLRSVFHLTEELMVRGDFAGLPESDLKHLSGDVKRVHTRLALQWLDYMKYLRSNHPYLFSLAMRLNPFDPGASPVVSEAA